MTDEERMLWTENGRLQGRVSELEAEVAKLLNAMADARTENMRLREWNAEIALNAKAFADALKEISDFDTDEDISNEECMRDIARAALNGEGWEGL